MNTFKLTNWLLCLAFISCTNNIVTESGNENLDNLQNSFIVSEAVAKQIAGSYDFTKSALRSSLESPQEKVIESSYSFTDMNSEPVMHIINYEKGGFVIISGDNRISPILAFSDIGCFSENQDDYPYGLTLWINEQKDIIQYIRENGEIQIDVVKKEWSKFLDKNTIETKATPPPTQECETSDEILVGPLLTTFWHQYPPFNTLLPALDCGPGGHVYAGCVQIAVAQVMKYHQYPTTYSWSSMPNTGASSFTQNLIKDLHALIKKDTDIDYDCNGTGISRRYSIADLFKKKLGYKYAIEREYIPGYVKNSVRDNKPVILRGTSGGRGHVWVCDGIESFMACAEGQFAEYLYLHMNWGWEDTKYNAWYGCSTFNPGSSNYKDIIMVYNIHP